MITLSEQNKRVTWRLDTAVHAKLTRISKASDLTLEEVANLVLLHQEWDSLKPHVQAHIREKKQAELRKKKAAEVVAQVDEDVLDKLSNLSADEIAALLK